MREKNGFMRSLWHQWLHGAHFLVAASPKMVECFKNIGERNIGIIGLPLIETGTATNQRK